MPDQNQPATETRVNADGSTVTGAAPIPAEPSLRADPATENRVNADGSTVTGIAPIPAETTSTADAEVVKFAEAKAVADAQAAIDEANRTAPVVKAIADVQAELDSGLGIIEGTYQHTGTPPSEPYPGRVEYAVPPMNYEHPLADELDELHELISHLPGAAALALHNIVKKIEAKL